MKLGYSIITLWGLFFGVRIVYFRELRNSVGQSLDQIFLSGQRAGRTDMVVAAIVVAFHFVLANLTRSYYNLHQIEDDGDEGSPLRRVICTFDGSRRLFETLLRLAMFIAIVVIVKTLGILEHETPDSGSLLTVAAFQQGFDQLWHIAIVYYVVLLTWDYIVWQGSKLQPSSPTTTAVARVITRRAVPVHACGLIVALAMCLPRHVATLSSFIDITVLGAFVVALAGCVLLVLSAISEVPTIWKSLFIAPNSGSKRAESEA